ncbi:thrombospondin type 3 repeat-containing protein [Candidatus Woesearchaeota archaeon]|nr:thrombospondin type 3 repeat-containing protein [Candidatus Woesearchaeota archaeon]
MKKLYYLIIPFLLIFIIGCSTCRKPYIEFKKGDCCLDSNSNGICDNDEKLNTKEVPDIQGMVVKEIEKENCPHECCNGINFKIKFCNDEDECINHKCILIDTDKDGLGDSEEIRLGTNPNLEDTDGDSLNDAVELNIRKTSPLNPNTDNDRYDDYEDQNPLMINSANININVEKVEDEEDVDFLEFITSDSATKGVTEASAVGGTIGSIFPGIGTATGASAGGGIIYFKNLIDYFKPSDIRTLKFTISNNGDDYTSFLNFKLYVKIAYSKDNEIISQKDVLIDGFSLGKIEVKEITEKVTSFSIKKLENHISSIFPEPNECEGIIFSSCKVSYNYFIDNIDFERFN